MRARSGTALTVDAGKPRSSITAAIGIETFIVSGLPQASRGGVAQRAGQRDVRPADAARVGELEDPLGARVERLVHGMAEAGQPAAGARGRRATSRGDRVRVAPAATRACASSSSRAHSSAVPRITGPQPRMPGRDRALQRPGVGGERHPRGDVGRHQAVLGDRDEQQVEEVALVLGRLAAGQQQVEVLGERQPAHQVAGEVAAADLDPVGVGLADAADRRARLPDDRHTEATLRQPSRRRRRNGSGRARRVDELPQQGRPAEVVRAHAVAAAAPRSTRGSLRARHVAARRSRESRSASASSPSRRSPRLTRTRRC